MRDSSLSKEQFTDLLSNLPSLNASCRDPDRASNTLYIYLMKMRTAQPHEDIGKVFGISKVTVGRRLNVARDALAKDFMSKHINIVQDREEMVQRSSTMCNGIFNPDGDKAILV